MTAQETVGGTQETKAGTWWKKEKGGGRVGVLAMLDLSSKDVAYES